MCSLHTMFCVVRCRWPLLCNPPDCSIFSAGEILEFKDDLHSLDKSKKKDAVKKVIAAMTVGKDVSMLFADVVNCMQVSCHNSCFAHSEIILLPNTRHVRLLMQTDDLELKKLVYLYLINYAKTQPDLAIMAVNTFVKANSSSTSVA